MICTVGQKPALHTLLSLYASVSDFLRPLRAEKLLALFYIDNNANVRKECYGTDFCVRARHERPCTQRKPVQTKLCMWCCTIKVDIENSKGQYIEKDKQEATKDGSESTKIQHGI